MNHWDSDYASYAKSIRFPTPKEKRVNIVRFVWSLRNHENPRTGKPYNEDDMAAMLKYKRKAFKNALLEAGIVRRPAPEVRTGKLPENELAFFSGFRHGSFEARELTWGATRLVAIETATKKKDRQHVIESTVGTWGEIHRGKSGVTVYLDPDNFKFMLDRSNNPGLLSDKRTYAPFLLGFLSMRMSEKEGRISSQDGDLIQGIGNGYQEHFGENLGYYFAEQRTDTLGVTHTLQIKNPANVIGTLIQEPNVRSLPFLPELLGKNGKL